MKKFLSVLMCLLVAFVFFTCDDSGGGGDGGKVREPDPMDLELDVSKWGTMPENNNNNGIELLKTQYAKTTYKGGKLTIEFSGINRERALIPVSAAQLAKFKTWDVGNGVEFEIKATIKDDGKGVGRAKGEDGKDEPSARFRCHLGDPSLVADGTTIFGWNASKTKSEGPLKEHMTEWADWESEERINDAKWFSIQAMYKNPANGETNNIVVPDTDPVQYVAFPKVTLVVSYINIKEGTPPEE
jgi:hypothetical protein